MCALNLCFASALRDKCALCHPWRQQLTRSPAALPPVASAVPDPWLTCAARLWPPLCIREAFLLCWTKVRLCWLREATAENRAIPVSQRSDSEPVFQSPCLFLWWGGGGRGQLRSGWRGSPIASVIDTEHCATETKTCAFASSNLKQETRFLNWGRGCF